LVARLNGVQKVVSSNLTAPTILTRLSSRGYSEVDRLPLSTTTGDWACNAAPLTILLRHASTPERGLLTSKSPLLVGDKTGPAIIATTYGDLRPDQPHIDRKAPASFLKCLKYPVSIGAATMIGGSLTSGVGAPSTLASANSSAIITL
jgi:hypothetical protein